MRRKHVGALAASATLALAGAAGAAAWPDRLDLPDGWQPEGIAKGPSNTLYVGSIPTGAVYEFDARTGAASVAVEPAAGRAAIGIKYDGGRLYVAGGPTGKAFVYDAGTGELLREYQLAPAGAATFVNDVVVTNDTAYFTDSRRGVIYAVPTDLGPASEIPVPDIPQSSGNNLNGIVAAKGGNVLLAVQGNVGKLWRIDPDDGSATLVDLGGYVLTNGDGLLLKGTTLYVVQNRLNRIAIFDMEGDFSSGALIDTIESEGFDVPTTIARKGSSLYAVNARFGTTDPQPADYWVTRVDAAAAR